MRAVRPSFRALAASLLPLILATCTQDTMGPVGRPGLAQIPLDLEAPNTSQFAGLSITSVRATVTKVDLVHDRTDTLLTKTAPFAADQNTLTLSLQLVLTQPEDTVDVTIDYLSGTLVVFTGVQSVIVKQGPAGSNGDVTVPVNYVGPGSSIAALNIQPRDSVVAAGGTLPFRVTARDSQAANVPSFYVSWTSGSATNPIDANGVLHAGTTRSTFFIHAETPTGIKDSTPVTIVPAPNSLLKVSGDAQTATVSTALPLPLTVEVRGTDNLPIKGVPVAFAVVSGGGSVDTATVVTGTNGRAATTVKLGATVGAQSFSATVTGVTAATFTATASAAGPLTRTWTGAASTDWFAAGNWSGNAAPRPVDTVAVPNTANKPTVGANDTVAAMTVATGTTVTLASGTNLLVTGGLNLSGTITGTNSSLDVRGAIATTAGSNLSPSVLFVGNTLTVGGTYNVSNNTIFQGAGQLIPSNVTYSTLSVTGTATLTGRTSVTSSTLVNGAGHLTLAGHTLVTGLLQVGAAAGETSQLVMTNAVDTVLATNALFQGGSESGALTAGVLSLTGNFTQTGLSSTQAFVATGSHKTVFTGTALQTLQMVNAGAALSRFNILDISTATGGVSLTSATYVAGQFVALPGAGGTPVLRGTTSSLTALGVNVRRLIVDTIPVIIGGGTFTRFDSVTFVHTGATTTALTINDPGAASPYLFDALNFGTVPTTGFYLRANDTDGATPNVLTLNLSNPTPGTAGGFGQVVNGAVINWPVVIPAQTWNGSVS
ncbi:MAG TPA: hypothetical protein VJN95_16595, partial [Gemmatimonadales bacterium]|nr:hypothetical protein [Gemmatimonadales bacterium]